MKSSILSLTLSAMILSGCNGTSDTITQQVNDLYERMTQEERINQLRSTYLNDYFDESGQLDTALCRRDLSNGIGHFSQFASQMSFAPDDIRDRVAAMQAWLMANTPSGIPALFHEEVLTGVCSRDATVYPQQIGMACSFNPELARLKAQYTGQGLRQMGGLLSLSPMVDVVRTPSFNRLEESYGEDAYLSAVFGTAFVQGLQHGGLRQGVGTCSKHYLGYGGGGDADEKELMEEILLPHETMIRLGGSKVVMPGYHAVHGTKCVANPEILDGILRTYLQYDGMVVSDYNAIDEVPGYDSDMERGVAAINAGNDVDFPRGVSYAHLQEAIDKGLVSQQTLERAVKRVLTYKARVGMLDKNPNLFSREHITFDTPEERQVAYDLASQSIVLLENNGILPLRQPQRIFLTGPDANTMWAMLGDYTFQSMRYFWQRKDEDDMHPKIVSLKEGLESRLPEGSSMTYSRGCDWTEIVETWIEEGGDQRADWLRLILDRKVQHPEPANTAEALRMARESDVIIAAMGENVLLCGENRERPTLRLPGRQEEYVESLLATGKPVILVVFGGRAQVISSIAKRCAAVIQAWYPGEEGGNAVADILFGRVSPSGKLCVSYPNTEVKTPLCYNYSSEQDSRVEWPFGYGLSYTSFQYSDLKADASVDASDAEFRLSFEVKNTGSVASDEVAQIYLSPTSDDQAIRPIQLQGFGRIHLEPGQSQRLSFVLPVEQFGHYADGQWHITPGCYLVKVGASSTDIRLTHEVELTGKAVVKPLRDTYFSHME
ncbi:MAG: glycoside hydrolase family 3 C-terminal domain-containing protein [Bacteroidales bacterium]|nr:glycoside hydrolase family 3 C-terminal domain-containing protein [Candidatus Liminaster caballi]